MLAKRRTPRDTARARYEIISIGISRGISPFGAPGWHKKSKEM